MKKLYNKKKTNLGAKGPHIKETSKRRVQKKKYKIIQNLLQNQPMKII